jgi:hypothetical protein
MMRIRFADFEFDRHTGELWEGGKATRLQPQPAKVLDMLVAQPGELLTRNALQHMSGGKRRSLTSSKGLIGVFAAFGKPSTIPLLTPGLSKPFPAAAIDLSPR